MGPWDALNQGFAQTFQSQLDQKQKQKLLEEEYKNRAALTQWQGNLDNQALTPEQKLMRSYQQNPVGFTGFRKALDPYQPAELAIKNALANTQQFNANTDASRVWNTYNPPQNYVDFVQGKGNNKQKDFQFLMSLPDMNQEKALQYLYRPDMMQQMMQMMMSGGGIPQGQGTPPASGGGLYRP